MPPSISTRPSSAQVPVEVYDGVGDDAELAAGEAGAALPAVQRHTVINLRVEAVLQTQPLQLRQRLLGRGCVIHPCRHSIPPCVLVAGVAVAEDGLDPGAELSPPLRPPQPRQVLLNLPRQGRHSCWGRAASRALAVRPAPCPASCPAPRTLVCPLRDFVSELAAAAVAGVGQRPRVYPPVHQVAHLVRAS